MEDTNIYSKIFMLLGKYGVKRIFGIPGREAQSYKFDEIPSISFVSMRNESAALISSGVYNFLMNGIKSVSWTTFGPGFANSVAGIYTCHMDGYPTIALSAQVETNLINPQTHQYINQEQLAKPISNFSYELKEDSNLPEVMSQAIINALTPKKDISFISIPLNLSIKTDESKLLSDFRDKISKFEVPKSEDSNLISKIEQLSEKITKSKFPLLLIGRECGDYQTKVRELIHKFHIPAVTTYQGKGIVSDEDENHIGTVSHYFDSLTRSEFISELLSSTDCLILLGYDMNELSYDYRLALFKPGKEQKIAIITPHKFSVPQELKIDYEINAPVNLVLDNLLKNKLLSEDKILVERKELLNKIKSRYKECLKRVEDDPMYLLIKGVRNCLGSSGIMITDTGIHKQYVSLFDNPSDFRKNLCSNGASMMGFGLPALIGAGFALKDTNSQSPVVLIAGDGGFHAMNQDLELIKRFNLPVTAIIVLKDNSFGLIKNYQIRGFNSFNKECIEFGEVDFVKIAEAQGLKGVRAKITDVPKIIKERIENKSEPIVIEVLVDYSNFFSYNVNAKWKEYKGRFD